VKIESIDNNEKEDILVKPFN